MLDNRFSHPPIMSIQECKNIIICTIIIHIVPNMPQYKYYTHQYSDVIVFTILVNIFQRNAHLQIQSTQQHSTRNIPPPDIRTNMVHEYIYCDVYSQCPEALHAWMMYNEGDLESGACARVIKKAFYGAEWIDILLTFSNKEVLKHFMIFINLEQYEGT